MREEKEMRSAKGKEKRELPKFRKSAPFWKGGCKAHHRGEKNAPILHGVLGDKKDLKEKKKREKAQRVWSPERKRLRKQKLFSIGSSCSLERENKERGELL